MKVAIVTNNYFPRVSGVSVAVRFLGTALRKMGHQTLVVAPDYGHSTAVDEADVIRVKSLHLKNRNVSLPLPEFDRDEVRDKMERWQPDIIHSHHPFLLGEAAVKAADAYGIPMCYTWHTLYEFFAHYAGLDLPLVKKIIQEYVVEYTHRCGLVITPTEPIREHILSLGVTTWTETVPTGIDFSRFERVTARRVEDLRRRFELHRFEHVLLSVGRIAKEKNVRLCLESLCELVKRGRNVGLLILGEGPDARYLARQASKSGMSERLVIGGFLDQETLAAAYSLGVSAGAQIRSVRGASN